MNLFYSFLLMFLLCACNQSDTRSEKRSDSGSTPVKFPADSSNALKEYELYLSELDSFNVETVSAAASKFQEIFATQDDAAKDKGFMMFNRYYEKMETNINELHRKDTTDFEPLITFEINGKKKVVSEKLKAYNDRLKKHGFEVTSTEGMTYIGQDRDLFSKWFYSHVSPAMKNYLEQLNRENKEGFANDAAIVIDASQFAERLAWWDRFIKDNPGFAAVKEANDHRKYLRTFFLTGMDNTPLIDYETNNLSGYYKTAYSYLQKNYPESESTSIVDPYFKALLQNDKAKAEALLNNYRRSGLIIDFNE